MKRLTTKRATGKLSLETAGVTDPAVQIALQQIKNQVNQNASTPAVGAAVQTSVPSTSGGGLGSISMAVPAFLLVTPPTVVGSGTFNITLSGTALPAANGGTGQTSVATAFASFFKSVATALGDLIFGGAAGTPTRLAGNVTTAKQWLSQTGTGAISATPVWSTIDELFLSGGVPLSAATTGVGIGQTSGLPFIYMVNAAAGLDAKVWQSYIDGSGGFHLAAQHDAFSGAADAITILRSGVAITSAALAGRLLVNGATDDTTSAAQIQGNARITGSVDSAGLKVIEGANARQGISTLVAGVVTVSNTSVTANTRIFLTPQTLGTVTAPKALGITARTPGASFTVTSADATDTSAIAWELFEPG